MTQIYSFHTTTWESPFFPQVRQSAWQALEAGQVLSFPSLAFSLSEAERRFLNPAILGRSKNVGYNPATQALGGTVCQGAEAMELKALLQRYADAARTLLERLLSLEGSALTRHRTSLRPAAVEGRVTSWRKDDTRLHVDSFPSQPVHGQRILRLFCNVNPQGKARTWRLGEPFPTVANRFWPRLAAPSRIKPQLLSWLRVTRGLRSEYDHYMLRLHDAMKADLDYQRTARQATIDFPSGSAWACFTDQVSHAALAGQHQLEQTFTIPVDAMRNPSTAPLKVLEQLAGRTLTGAHRKAA